MPKEELIAGLKQAIEKGESLEKAKQSFINAGYNANEVKEAASFVSSGVLTSIPELPNYRPTTPQQTIKQQIIPTQIQQPQIPTRLPNQQFQQPKKSKGKILIIILAIFLLILISGLIATIFFKDKIIEIINNIV